MKIFFKIIMILVSISTVSCAHQENASPRDLESNLKDISELCLQKDPDACGIHGMIKLKNNLITEGKKDLSFACKNKDASSCYIMGKLEKEDKKVISAMSFFGMACNLKYNDSCQKYAELKIYLLDTKETIQKSKLHCEKNKLNACFNVGLNLFEIGFIEESSKWLQQSCDANIAQACQYQGLVKESQNKPQEAQELYSKACKLGDQKACILIIK